MAFAESLNVLEQAVARDPGCGLTWSLLGLLYRNNHTFQFSPMEPPMDQALKFTQKGELLEPQN